MAATTLHEQCPTCEGVGWYVCDSNLCVRCDGTGRVDSPEALAMIETLRAERDQARDILRRCRDAAGMRAASASTGHQDLIDQIDELNSRSASLDDAEADVRRLEAEAARGGPSPEWLARAGEAEDANPSVSVGGLASDLDLAGTFRVDISAALAKLAKLERIKQIVAGPKTGSISQTYNRIVDVLRELELAQATRGLGQVDGATYGDGRG